MKLDPKRFIPLTKAIAGRLSSAAGVLLLSMLVSQQLSLNEAGAFFAAFTTLMGAVIFLQLGLGILLIRKIATSENTGSSSVFLSSIILVLATSVPAAGILLLIDVAAASPTPLSKVWMPLIPASLLGMIGAFFKGHNWPGFGGLFEVGMISTIAVIACYLWPPQTGLEAWRILTAAAWLSVFLAGFAVFASRLQIGSAANLDLELAIEARYFWGNNILSYVAQWCGVFIVAALMSTSDVAALNAVLRLLAPLQFVILTLDYFLAPKLAQSPPRLALRLRNYGALACLGLSIPYAGALLIFPDWFLSTLFGDAYAPYASELRIVTFSVLLQMSLGPNGIFLNMRGREHISMYGVALRGIVSIAVSAIAIPLVGVIGAAIAFAVAIIAQAVYYRASVDRSVSSGALH